MFGEEYQRIAGRELINLHSRPLILLSQKVGGIATQASYVLRTLERRNPVRLEALGLFVVTVTQSLHTNNPIASSFQAMSFSSLVQDIAYRDSKTDDTKSSLSRPSQARSYNSTAATSVSIAGDISSQLHAGYSHPLSRAWQAERQLTKV